MELLLEAAMEHKAIAQLGNFATPTVCVLIYVRNIQPKAMVMEPKEIAIINPGVVIDVEREMDMEVEMEVEMGAEVGIPEKAECITSLH